MKPKKYEKYMYDKASSQWSCKKNVIANEDVFCFGWQGVLFI